MKTKTSLTRSHFLKETEMSKFSPITARAKALKLDGNWYHDRHNDRDPDTKQIVRIRRYKRLKVRVDPSDAENLKETREKLEILKDFVEGVFPGTKVSIYTPRVAYMSMSLNPGRMAISICFPHVKVNQLA